MVLLMLMTRRIAFDTLRLLARGFLLEYYLIGKGIPSSRGEVSE
jgi:hypothetical protein